MTAELQLVITAENQLQLEGKLEKQDNRCLPARIDKYPYKLSGPMDA